MGLAAYPGAPYPAAEAYRYLTPEEADRLIAAANDALRPLVVFMLYTAGRRGAMARLETSRPYPPPGPLSRRRRTATCGPSRFTRAPSSPSPIFPAARAKCFAGRTARRTSDRSASTIRARGAGSKKRSGARAAGPISRILGFTIFATLGRRGTTPRTAISIRLCSLADGGRSEWSSVTPTRTSASSPIRSIAFPGEI
jgi:hypothetical protein